MNNEKKGKIVGPIGENSRFYGEIVASIFLNNSAVLFPFLCDSQWVLGFVKKHVWLIMLERISLQTL